MALEIERKFLLGFLPEQLPIEKKKTIYQSYLATGKEEVRIRKVEYKDSESKFYLTYKNRTCDKLQRQEIEMEITEKTYDQLNDRSKPVIKERLLIGLENGLKAEVDVFLNIGFELRTVEVEFGSLKEAEKFIAPSWFDRELTGTGEFNNQSLWEKINGVK